MAGTEVSVMKELKGILATDNVKNRFNEVLGKKAPQFMTSIINVVSQSNQLKQCSANSIMSSALVAASYDLPIDSNLGFSALVPYKVKGVYQAQFQIMYKGFIHACDQKWILQKNELLSGLRGRAGFLQSDIWRDRIC